MNRTFERTVDGASPELARAELFALAKDAIRTWEREVPPPRLAEAGPGRWRISVSFVPVSHVEGGHDDDPR